MMILVVEGKVLNLLQAGQCERGSSYHWIFSACPFGYLKRVSKSVQVLLNGIEAIMALPLIILK